MGNDSSISGLDELLSTFQKLPVAMEKEAVSPGVEKAAEIMVAAVKRRTKRSQVHKHHQKYGHRPGFLHDSIESKKLKSEEAVSILVGYRKEAFYAHYLEKGTSRMKATPFLRPAFQESKAEAEAAAVGIMKDNIGKAVESARPMKP